MKPNSETSKRERQDWGIVLLILVFGFLCVILAAQWALHFSPSWQVNADMESDLDLNSEFLQNRPIGFIEPVDPGILTQPGWANFLTPDAIIVTRTPLPAGQANAVPTQEITAGPVTNTVAVIATNTTVPTNTFVWLPLPATATRKPKEIPAETLPAKPSADLAVTIANTIGSYSPGASTTYTITITNNGPDSITGATVIDNFNAPINGFGLGGTCTPAGGASCGAWSGSGDINDTVNLSAGSSITYTVPVTTDFWDLLDLVNQVSVTAAGYTETAPGNETASHTNSLAINPSGAIGSSSDCPGLACTEEILAGQALILNISVTPNGDPLSPDLIYYEEPVGGDILMDWVVLQISDGTNSYTILDWGNYGGGAADSNTNIDVSIIGGSESDNQTISQTDLYPNPGWGITIDLDSLGIPSTTTYTYLRIFAPPGDADGGLRMDAIDTSP